MAYFVRTVQYFLGHGRSVATSPAVFVISLLVGLLTILHSSGFQRMRIPSRRLVNQGMKSVNGRLFSEFGDK